MSTKEEEEAAASPPAAGKQEPQKQEQPKKKKERVIVTPPCPTSVSTGYLVIRSAIMGVVGVSNETANFTILQPTYIKDKEPTGKFGINLGKKLGNCQLDLSENEEERVELLKAIENACNRIIKEENGTNIYVMKASKEMLKDTYGVGLFDASHSNDKKCPLSKELTCAIVGEMSNFVCMAVPPSIPHKSTGCIEKIEFDMKQSSITSGSRKAEIVIKFKVTEKSASEEETAGLLEFHPTSMDESLKQMIVRMPEGQVLLEKQQAQQQDTEKEIAEVTTATAKATITETTTTPAAATTTVDTTTKEEEEAKKFFVSVEKVEGEIDYNKLVDQFGSKLINDEIMKQITNMTVGKGRVDKLHRFLRRNIFFSHRDLIPLLECVSTGKPMYLYTGRGPSSSAMHLGHLIPFLFTQWLQKAFDCPLVIQMTDDEKFLFKGEYTDEKGDNLDYFKSLTLENARDIIACGFNYDKTFIFSDLDYVGRMYPNIVRIWKSVTTNTVNGIFGFEGTSNIGKIAFPAVQAAPSFASSFPTVLNATRNTDMCCLIPCAIDQDPYFRMTRDVSHKILTNKQHKLGGKPALIHSKFFPPLQGASGKMSSSDTNSAIFLTDTPEQIEDKIKNYAFSGGQETKKLQEEHGANLEVDVSYQWLRFFLEDDDLLEVIKESYGSGKGEYWSTTIVKKKLIEILQKLVAEHQERRAKITDEEVYKWMTERCIL